MTQNRTCLASFALLGLLAAAPRAAAQTPVQSFADLPSVAKVGQRVVVTDDKGTVTKGHISSITGDKLLIRPAWRLLGPRTPTVFTEASIVRVEHGDGNWNGGLIGAAVGILGAWLVGEAWTGDESGFGLMAIVLILSPAAGAQIDDAIHRPLFISPRQVRTSVAPIAGRGRIGMSVTLRF